jgi:Flp pilus assembly protein TadG
MNITIGRPTEPRRRPREGQILVIFALAVVVMMAMGGLILDGGAAFAHRRDAQNAADLAALAGANAYLDKFESTPAVAEAAAIAVARQSATGNGYTDGAGSVSVDVSVDTTNGAAVTVDISTPHANNFSALLGMPTWTVSTTATARTGFPSAAQGAAPFIFNVDVFQTNGTPNSQYANPSSPFSFGDGNGDVPNNPDDIAWTCYGTCGNVDTNTVRRMIDGSAPVNVELDPTVDFRTYIGQHNNGNHTALYREVDDYLAGQDVAVPIVDDNGLFQGWATFHVVSATGGSSKVITGYFKSDFQNSLLSVHCPIGGCPRYFGSYELKLIN